MILLGRNVKRERGGDFGELEEERSAADCNVYLCVIHLTWNIKMAFNF